MFGENVAHDLKNRICEVLQVPEVADISSYLGLPLSFSSNKSECFRHILERVRQRISGWAEGTLSSAGKEILIKSVVQALPTYAMSCFKIPSGLIKKIVSAISSFWWSNKKDSKGILWCKFEKTCERKEIGGLGFRDLEVFNDAMLGKQFWRLLKYPESLVGKVMKAKYFREGTVLDSSLGSRPSVAWRSIWNSGMKLTGLMSYSNEDQGWVWSEEPNKIYSVRSAYRWMMEKRAQAGRDLHGESSDSSKNMLFWRKIWKLDVQPKVRIFVWRMINNFLPCAVNLTRKGIGADQKCPVCGFQSESIMHTLQNCWWARLFWRHLGGDDDIMSNEAEPWDWVWHYVFNRSTSDLKKLLIGARWIWFNRNSLANGALGWNPDSAARAARIELEMANNKVKFQMVTSINDGMVWCPPPAGCLKFNVDGARNQESGLSGIGICCKDEGGVIVLVEAEFVGHVTSSDEVELLALRRAMKIAESKGMRKVIFETDNAKVALGVRRGFGGDHLNHDMVKDCRGMLESNMHWSINTIFRDANGLADFLASKAKADHWCWKNYEAVPRCLAESF